MTTKKTTDVTIPASNVPAMEDGGFRALTSPRTLQIIQEVAPTPYELTKLTIPSGSGGAFFTVERLEGDVPEKELHVVVAHDSGERRSFYATDIDSGDGGPPHCSSEDAKTGYGVRDVEAILEAGEQWTALEKSTQKCGKPKDPEGCPFAKYGSSLNGRDGQACSMQRLLVVFDPASALPMLLQISPASLKNFRSYTLRLAGGEVMIKDVVTKLTLEKCSGSPDYYKIKFEFDRQLVDEEKVRLGEITTVIAEAMADRE